MAEFERPRAKALSDAELARALQTFPSDANGLELAAKLMAEQQKLREQDSQELQAWIELLRARDDQQSRKILSESMASIFPAEHVEEAPHVNEPAVLTSQLPVITRRGRVSNRLRNSQVRRLLVTSVLLAVSSALVLDWLELQGLSAILSLVTGLTIALLISTPLKRHLLHPILRSAAVFGGRGVYAFSALILGATSLFFIAAFDGHSDLPQLASVGPYSAVIIILVASATLIGQVVPVRFGSALILLVTLGSFGLLISGEVKPIRDLTLQQGSHWGAASVAVISTIILLAGMPHTKVSWGSAAWMLPATTLIALPLFLLVPYSVEFALPVAVFALMLGLVYSGRDLAGGSLGRLAGLSLVLGLAFSPLTDWLSGVVMAILVCALTLMLLDQLFRTSALHVASLDTSYGFYGSVSITGWFALTISAALGTPVFTALLPDTFNHLEWSLIGGLATGLLVGLMRIPVIRRQDREIKNLDSSSGNIENLLGL
jgi:hypothetical protein